MTTNAQKGLDYITSGEYEKALKFLNKAKLETPDDPSVWLNLSAALYATNKLKEGLKNAKLALELNPTWGLALNNVGLYAHKTNDPASAAPWFKKAGDAGYIDGYFNYALAKLKEDIHSEEGWKYYSYRFFRSAPVKLSNCFVPNWEPTMTPQEAGRVLVMAEQGFGDLINFSRYAYHLQDLGYDVTLQCFTELIDMFPGIKVTNRSSGDYDHKVPLMTLPGIYGVLPLQEGFKRETSGNRIGFCYKGSAAHVNDLNRSLPKGFFKRFAAYGELVNLQFGDNPSIKSFKDTLELASSCAVVVTIDSAPLHLCGLHGIPTIALLPAIDSDFRWGVGTEKCVWYPSVTLVRDMNVDRVEEILRGLNLQ